MRNLGFSVLLFDYRGFGRSDGAFPSEASVYQDAECAWRHVVCRVGGKAQNAFIYGHSLGGAVAIELALHHPDAAGLIVESSFTSMRDMGTYLAIFRIFPLLRFVRHHFESIAKVSSLKMPVLFIHGTKDLTVPCRMSRELFAAAVEPKRLVIIPGGHHLDNATVGGRIYLDALGEFLSG
jgi:pimeloyl-ACP methyl ester carboxylesterase